MAAYEVKDAVAIRCPVLPETLEEALAKDAGAAEAEGTRAEIRVALETIWQDPEYVDDLVEGIPPENYKPIAASLLLTVLEHCNYYPGHMQGFDPDIDFNRIATDMLVSSNILRFYYTGDGELSEEQRHAIWQDPTHDYTIGLRQHFISKMHRIVHERISARDSPPCKKKGGKKSRKSKRHRKQKQSRKY
jgi:hypothetical protein